MTDSQTPRPTLKLNLKPAFLESLANKKPKQTIIIPETPQNTLGNKVNTLSKKVDLQANGNKLAQTPPKRQKEKKHKEPKPPKKVKEVIPVQVREVYDFLEVYNKLHEQYPKAISLKNPQAFAIGIRKSIKEASGLSNKNTDEWTAEYLKRCNYHKKVHVAGANRYNLAGEITGTVTQEECDARQEIFKNFKKNPKKT